MFLVVLIHDAPAAAAVVDALQTEFFDVDDISIIVTNVEATFLALCANSDDDNGEDQADDEVDGGGGCDDDDDDDDGDGDDGDDDDDDDGDHDEIEHHHVSIEYDNPYPATAKERRWEGDSRSVSPDVSLSMTP